MKGVESGEMVDVGMVVEVCVVEVWMGWCGSGVGGDVDVVNW